MRTGEREREQLREDGEPDLPDRSLNIAFLSWEYPPCNIGGIASHVSDLTRALAALGHRVHIITLGSEEVSGHDRRDGVLIHRVQPPMVEARDFVSEVMQTNFKLVEEGTRLLNEQEGDIDLIHAHDWLVCWAGKTLKHAYRKPLLATIHATEFGRNNGLHNRLQYYINDIEWLLSYEAWKVICCSEYMMKEIGRVFSLPRDKIFVVPNGVNSDEFTVQEELNPGFRQKYATPGEKIIYFVGRLVREKGIQVLIDAAPRLLQEVPEAKFVISGTGPYANHLRYMVETRGLAHKFCFTGYVDDRERNQLYREAEVAVFPSLYEPFGIVVLEGMAAGLPVVASDVGGISEIIHDGYNGLKVAPDNPGMLADKLALVLTDDRLAGRIADQGQRMVEEEYSWERIARRTLGVYGQVLTEYERQSWKAKKDLSRGSEHEDYQRYTAEDGDRKRKGEYAGASRVREEGGYHESGNNGWR